MIDLARRQELFDKGYWEVPDNLDTTNFDFSWRPDPWDRPYIHQFGTQHQKTGGPRFVIPENEGIKYQSCQHAIRLPKPDDRSWRTLYSNVSMDYSWHPDDCDPPYIYIFGNQFFDGEDMPTVQYRTRGAVQHKFVKDITSTLTNTNELIETLIYKDSIFDALVNHTFTKPFVHITYTKSTTNPVNYIGNSLLHEIDGIEVIASEHTVKYLYDKIYDYPELKRHNIGNKPELLDIVFFSNNEACAEDNYQHLLSLNLPNRIVRVDGVNGRVLSQQAAANSSNTEWYFLVNAKLKVNKDFDFSWQPDRLKSRRHYIFKALNPLNNLEYGHMAMVANNKTLTMSTKGYGLDFTMESPTEVVDMLSGTAVFNSEWDVWRTAFREVIKLCYAKDSESKKRLEVWTTVATGPFAQSSLQGAKDAVEYYESVNGDFEKLKLSYDWAWLREIFNK